MDDNLKFNYHTQAAVAGVNQTLGTIKNTISSKFPAIVTKLYKSLLRHRLEYEACIGMPINKTEQMALKPVQTQATKCVKGYKDKEYGC